MTRYIPGLILIFLGLVIVAFPMLLVAFVSALLILAGIMVIAFARRIRQFEYEIGRLCNSKPFTRSFENQ